MAAMYRLKGLGWLASCAVVAIGFYLVSSQVAAERKRLEQVDVKIASAQRDIRALETEFDVRANLAQLERWNGDTLALTVPTAAQFVRDEEALASLSPAVRAAGAEGAGVQTAQLIVPSSPAFAAAATPVVAALPMPATGIVKVAAVRAAATSHPRLTPAVASAATPPVRAMKAVAMLDRSLLSDTTVGDLLSGARAERRTLR